METQIEKMRTIARERFGTLLHSGLWFLARALEWAGEHEGRFSLVHTSGGWRAKIEWYGLTEPRIWRSGGNSAL